MVHTDPNPPRIVQAKRFPTSTTANRSTVGSQYGAMYHHLASTLPSLFFLLPLSKIPGRGIPELCLTILASVALTPLNVDFSLIESAVSGFLFADGWAACLWMLHPAARAYFYNTTSHLAIIAVHGIINYPVALWVFRSRGFLSVSKKESGSSFVHAILAFGLFLVTAIAAKLTWDPAVTPPLLAGWALYVSKWRFFQVKVLPWLWPALSFKVLLMLNLVYCGYWKNVNM